jgi:protein-disulfide isomerase
MGDAIVKSLLIAGALIALSASIALGQSADDLASIRRDINALKEGQAAVLRELQQIRTLLSQGQQGRAAAPQQEAVVSVRGNGAVKGSKDARVTLVEFTDYQ